MKLPTKILGFTFALALLTIVLLTSNRTKQASVNNNSKKTKDINSISSKILFSRESSGSSYKNTLHAIDPNGKNERKLIFNSPSSRGEYNISASPDGKKLST